MHACSTNRVRSEVVSSPQWARKFNVPINIKSKTQLWRRYRRVLIILAKLHSHGYNTLWNLQAVNKWKYHARVSKLVHFVSRYTSILIPQRRARWQRVLWGPSSRQRWYRNDPHRTKRHASDISIRLFITLSNIEFKDTCTEQYTINRAKTYVRSLSVKRHYL